MTLKKQIIEHGKRQRKQEYTDSEQRGVQFLLIGKIYMTKKYNCRKCEYRMHAYSLKNNDDSEANSDNTDGNERDTFRI